MGKRQPFIIGNSLFLTKAALQEEIRRKIALYEDTEPFSADDESFFLDLLEHHPRASLKIGCGVLGFYVSHNPVYPQTRCLYLIREDGSSTDWSWTECLRPTPHHKKIQRACRALLEPHMMGMKRALFSKREETPSCPITGRPMTFTTAHVDHIPPLTFATLFSGFIEHEQIDLTTVSLRSEGEDNTSQDILADENLASRWLTYHSQFAHLRVISARANLSEVKRGWQENRTITPTL